MQKAMHRKLHIKGKIQKNTAPTQKYITTEKSSHNGIKLRGIKITEFFRLSHSFKYALFLYFLILAINKMSRLKVLKIGILLNNGEKAETHG